jgi:O-antigen/teichoic acid export membrane protein
MATRAHHQVTLVALGENALRFALAMTAIVAGGGVVALAASVAVSRFAGMIASAVLVERSGVRDAWRPVPVGQLRDFAAAVAPFGLLLFAGMAYFRLDVLMSEALLGAVPTGVYAAALTFYTAAMIVPDGLMAAVYPRLAARFRESPDGYAQATRMTVRMVTAALVPVSLGLVCLAPLLLKVAYGGRYAGAVPVLRLLAASLPIHAANAALGQALLAGNLQGPMLRGTLVSLVLHAVTLGLFLPRVGIVAAPVSMAFSSALFTAWCAWVFHRRVSRLSWDPSLARNMAAIVVPIALTLAAPEGWTLAGAVVGLAFLAAVGGRTLLAGVEFAPAAAPRLGKDPA